MAAFMRKTMLYLGLGPDDEYDDPTLGRGPDAGGHSQPQREQFVGARSPQGYESGGQWRHSTQNIPM